MINDYIEIPEIAERLCVKSVDKERYVRDFLLKNGIKMFRRGGIYVREYVLEAIEKEKERCLQPVKSAKSTMSGEQCVWANKQLKSQKGLLDFAKQAMQKNMSVA